MIQAAKMCWTCKEVRGLKNDVMLGERVGTKCGG